MAIKPNIKHKSHYNQKISNPSQKLIYSEVLLNPIWHKGLQSFIWAWCSLKLNLPCILEMYYGNISNVTNASQWVPDNWTKLTYNHTKYKRLTLLCSCHQVSTGQPDLYQMNFQKKKSGISELSGFQNCTWTTKSSETRGTGNSGSRWLNEEKCFPPQVPGQKL